MNILQSLCNRLDAKKSQMYSDGGNWFFWHKSNTNYLKGTISVSLTIVALGTSPTWHQQISFSGYYILSGTISNRYKALFSPSEFHLAPRVYPVLREETPRGWCAVNIILSSQLIFMWLVVLLYKLWRECVCLVAVFMSMFMLILIIVSLSPRPPPLTTETDTPGHD